MEEDQCVLWLTRSISVSTQAQGKLEKSGEGERDGGKAATEHMAGVGGKPHSAAAASGVNSEKKTSGKGRQWKQPLSLCISVCYQVQDRKHFAFCCQYFQ